MFVLKLFSFCGEFTDRAEKAVIVGQHRWSEYCFPFKGLTYMHTEDQTDNQRTLKLVFAADCFAV